MLNSSGHARAHQVYFTDSRDLSFIPSASVQLVVTSPPYPMIEMWDTLFSSLNNRISRELREDPALAFESMHGELDKVWTESFRVLSDGGILCVNIGDATRTINDRFQLYPNHARVIQACGEAGFHSLPVILWRKTTNAPNKFMGSGMLAPSAYVTLEHEYILIFRKGGKRIFKTQDEKQGRRESAYFWEERNSWFSDIWTFTGIRQDLDSRNLRKRSAAFPFELAYRLVNMYSVQGDTVLDPFLGTGTTMFAAMASSRNSLGVEKDKNFADLLNKDLTSLRLFLNQRIASRLQSHRDFIQEYTSKKGPLKYRNLHYSFAVVTRQETGLLFPQVKEIRKDGQLFFSDYHLEPQVDEVNTPLLKQLSLF